MSKVAMYDVSSTHVSQLISEALSTVTLSWPL